MYARVVKIKPIYCANGKVKNNKFYTMRFHRCVEQKLNIDPIKACHNITDHNCMSIIPTETEIETGLLSMSKIILIAIVKYS